LDNIPAEVRLIIFTGSGKSFVAGADISEMAGKSKAEAQALAELGQSTFNKIENLNLPVIAAVNGFALGGGCELAMACDFRIASTKAKFGQPEVNLGIIPGYGGSQRLSRLSGMGNAMYMIMTGAMIDATEAKNIGLVQKVVEPEQLLRETIKIAQTILAKGPNTIPAAKRVVRDGFKATLQEGLDMEADEFSTLFESDAKEGMTAFLEKRNPNWK
ncbi:MAG: enoyl-CoA hydratase-related protein, partial [Bacteroidales bacterium]|nr:enoyl-CoA hydratase-related protein [Bacteroidales bacterium]